MEPGQVVEFIDSRKIYCAAVLETKNMRLRLLTENNREMKMAAGRLTHRSDQRLSPSLGRDKLAAALKQIAGRRRDLSLQVDVQGLWEVLNSEQEWIDVATMTQFAFSDTADSDHESAVVRAFFDDRLYFKFGTDRFLPNTTAKVEQILVQREKEARNARIIEQGGRWLQKGLKGQSVEPPVDKAEIVRILSSYCLHEKESPERDSARAILHVAGVKSPGAIHGFLVKIGVWHPHENLDLLRHEISADMPDAVARHAIQLCRQPPVPETTRRDLRELPTITIDGPGTQDFDDALSVTRQDDDYLLGIHIADVGHCIAKADPLDQEALSRASSIYTPDRRIPMLPSCLSLDLCSLKAREDRAAISTLVTLSELGRIKAFEVVASLIRVDRQLTYQDADEMVEGDEMIRHLHLLAEAYHNRRLDNGALSIDLPEINIWLNAEGEPEMSRGDRQSPSHLIVSELMILTNELAARMLSERHLPAIFRSQAEPRERLFDRDQGTLFQNWMQRRFLNRFVLGTMPEPHAGLGVPAYVTSTSPIRKYSDLVVQRQVRAALGLETAYSDSDLKRILAELEQPMGLVGRIQYNRHRYWLLKYLEGRIGQKEEAYVLNKRREGFTVLIPGYMLECNLTGADNVSLKPEDLVQVTIQHVNARNDTINVYLG